MSFFEYSTSYEPLMPICEVFLGSGGSEPSLGPIEALVDTGADISIVPIAYLHTLRAQRVNRGRARSVWGDARTVDVYAVSLRLDGIEWKALQVLSDEVGMEIVLGRQVLNRLVIHLDGPAATLEIR